MATPSGREKARQCGVENGAGWFLLSKSEERIPINEYTGIFSEFYDILHPDMNDITTYETLLRPYGKSVLELGVGTGRLAIPLAEAGFEVTGLDNEPDMIARLEEKEYPRDRLTVKRGDGRRFSLDRAFDSILMPCNFINHFLDSGDLLDSLVCCHMHLRPGGLMVIDNSAPDVPYMVRANGGTQTTDYPTREGGFMRCHFYASFDFVSQIERDVIHLEEYLDGVITRKARARMTLTYYHPREIRALAHRAGFRVLLESGHLPTDVQHGSPIGEGGKEIVFLCGK